MYCVMLTERAEGLSCSVTCLYIAVLAVSRFFMKAGSIYSPGSAGCAELPPTLSRSFYPWAGARDFAYQALPRLNFPGCKGHEIITCAREGEPGDEANTSTQHWPVYNR